MNIDYCNARTVIGGALFVSGLVKYACCSEKKYQKASAVMVMSIGVAAFASGYFQALDGIKATEIQVKLAAEIAHQDFCPSRHLVERADSLAQSGDGIGMILSSLSRKNYLKWQDSFYGPMEQRIVNIQPEYMKKAVMWGFTPENASFVAFRGSCGHSEEGVITVFQTTKNKIEDLMVSGLDSLSSPCKEHFKRLFRYSVRSASDTFELDGGAFWFRSLIEKTFLKLAPWKDTGGTFYLGHDHDFISHRVCKSILS